jgi:hypothetical protein
VAHRPALLPRADRVLMTVNQNRLTAILSAAEAAWKKGGPVSGPALLFV